MTDNTLNAEWYASAIETVRILKTKKNELNENHEINVLKKR